MEVNFILKPNTLQNTCYLCFNESLNTVNIDVLIEIHYDDATVIMTLRNITKYLLSSYDILLHQACNSCADLIIRMFLLMKRASIKINAIEKLISKINKEMVSKTNSNSNQILINIADNNPNMSMSKELIPEDGELNLAHRYLFVCNLCNIKLKTEADLKLHKQINHNLYNKSLVCATCGKTFKNTTLLNSHLSTHKQTECPYCFKILKNNSYYKIHVKNHIKYTKRKVNSSYRCDDCGHETCNKIDLTTHMNKYHLNIRPYICQKCPKRFYSQRNLNEHILIHVNEKRHTCELCGDNFSGKPALLNHLKLHSGHRPYKCGICNHSFVTASRRNEHEKRKHGTKQFSCSKCNKMYCLKKTLNFHLRNVHGDYKTDSQ